MQLSITEPPPTETKPSKRPAAFVWYAGARELMGEHGRSEYLDLPEKVDVLVSEWMGFFALAEFYIPHYQVNDIQERLLAYGRILAAAALVPNRVAPAATSACACSRVRMPADALTGPKRTSASTSSTVAPRGP